jgi:cobalt/nickel transport system permease protein
VEGLDTAGVLLVLGRARPDLAPDAAAPPRRLAPVLAGLGVAALVVGGAVSTRASAEPDGLEWSIARVAGAGEVEGARGAVHALLARAQETTALLPDYAVAGAGEAAGTSVSGLLGAAVTLAVAALAAAVVRLLARGRARAPR